MPGFFLPHFLDHPAEIVFMRPAKAWPLLDSQNNSTPVRSIPDGFEAIRACQFARVPGSYWCGLSNQDNPTINTPRKISIDLIRHFGAAST